MVASTWTMLYQFDWLTMHNKNCLCEESFDFTQNKLRDEAIRFRFLTAPSLRLRTGFGMTICARLHRHGVYPEKSKDSSHDKR